jgi:hypothetical protein
MAGGLAEAPVSVGAVTRARGVERGKATSVAELSATETGPRMGTTPTAGASAALVSPGVSTKGSSGARARWTSSGKGAASPPSVSNGTGTTIRSTSTAVCWRESSTASGARAPGRS